MNDMENDQASIHDGRGVAQLKALGNHLVEQFETTDGVCEDGSGPIERRCERRLCGNVSAVDNTRLPKRSSQSAPAIVFVAIA